jgi:hypothetical protein
MPIRSVAVLPLALDSPHQGFLVLQAWQGRSGGGLLPLSAGWLAPELERGLLVIGTESDKAVAGSAGSERCLAAFGVGGSRKGWKFASSANDGGRLVRW